MSDAPRRRLELELTLSADTLEDLYDALQQIGTDLLIENREERITASGGYRSGYSMRLTVDPEMDGDRYRREVTEHVRGLGNGSRTQGGAERSGSASGRSEGRPPAPDSGREATR